ncbi:MAG: M23 family metallopeptidase [Leptospiraceae bacterium]|nr:M23 family metallopeptidase [Leptospiraceae bacterium]
MNFRKLLVKNFLYLLPSCILILFPQNSIQSIEEPDNQEDENFKVIPVRIQSTSSIDSPDGEKNKNTWVSPKSQYKAPGYKSKFTLDPPTRGSWEIHREFNDDPRNPHKGLSLRMDDSEIVSARTGKVVNVTSLFGYKNVVIVEHEKGIRTVYANLEEVSVKAGEIVKSGKKLGNVNKNRNLYFMVCQHEEPKDPMIYLK